MTQILETTAERVDREDLTIRLQEEALTQYDLREQELGEELMRALERFLLLQIIDQRWREHLHDMDYLQQGIHLRSAAQMDPLVAYKNEAFTLFGDLMNMIWTDFAQMIFHVQVTVTDDPDRVLRHRRRRGGRALRLRRPPGAGGSRTRAARACRRVRRRWRPRLPRRTWTTTAGPTGSRAWYLTARRSSSSSVGRRTSPGATTRAGAGRVRSTRGATAPSGLARPKHQPSALERLTRFAA